jgi:hypothetical protein
VKDNRPKMRTREFMVSFYQGVARSEPCKRTRVSICKAKKGLRRRRRLLDKQVVKEESSDV